MALILHMPMNGNLNNYGLSSTNPTYASAVYGVGNVTNKALNLNTVLNYSFSVPELNGATKWSVAFWIKPEVMSSGVNWSTFLYMRATNDNSLRFCYGGTTTYSNATYAVLLADNSDHKTLSSNLRCTANEDFGRWMHVCVTYNGVNVLAYCDGVLVYSNSTGLNNSLTGNFLLAPYGYNGLLNDLRVYNTVLTAAQVKTLARGLVLHYPLSHEGFGGENLLKNSTTNFPELWSGSGDGRTMNTQSGVNVPEWGCTNALRVYGKSGASSALCLLINNTTHGLSVNQTSVNGQKYVASIFVKNNHSSNAISFSFNNLATSVSVPANSQKRVILYAIGNGSNYLQYNISSSGTSKDYDITFWHPQIEFGDICTPWTPNSADALYTSLAVGSTTLHDVSGFQHNGTNYGTIAYSADTPRYKVSRVFNGSNNWVTTAKKMDFIKEAITLTYWAKADNWSSMTGTAVSCIESGGWGGQKWGSAQIGIEIGTGTSSLTWLQYACDTESFTGWHHFALTYDGYIFKVYVDGVEKYTNTKYTTKTPIYYNASATANALFIGGECGGSLTTPTDYFAGKVSDVRVYATALSAAEIQDIYKGVM